jgi:hypothetical protein
MIIVWSQPLGRPAVRRSLGPRSVEFAEFGHDAYQHTPRPTEGEQARHRCDWQANTALAERRIVALANSGCSRRPPRAKSCDIRVLQRKRSYQFHLRWGRSDQPDREAADDIDDHRAPGKRLADVPSNEAGHEVSRRATERAAQRDP